MSSRDWRESFLDICRNFIYYWLRLYYASTLNQPLWPGEGSLSGLWQYRLTLNLRSEVEWKWKSFSRVQLTATAWNSPGWNTGVGSFSLLRGSSPPRPPTLQADSLPTEPQGKPKNPGVSSLSLLQVIFLTQELNRGFLHCRHVLYQLSYKGRQLRRKSSPKWKLMQKHCTHPLDLAFVLETSKLADCLNVIISPWFSFSKWEVGEDAWEPASSFLKVYLFLIEG